MAAGPAEVGATPIELEQEEEEATPIELEREEELPGRRSDAHGEHLWGLLGTPCSRSVESPHDVCLAAALPLSSPCFLLHFVSCTHQQTPLRLPCRLLDVRLLTPTLFH